MTCNYAPMCAENCSIICPMLSMDGTAYKADNRTASRISCTCTLCPDRKWATGNFGLSDILGYKGLIDLAYRSGEVSIIQAHTVRENDDFTYELGLDPKLYHVPARSDRGKAVAYYAMFKTRDGGYGFQVMTIDEINAHARAYSKSFGSGPWQTNFDEMAKKTVLKKVLKYAPLKSDFVRGISQDSTIKNDIAEDMADIPDSTEYVDVDQATGEVIDTAAMEDIQDA